MCKRLLPFLGILLLMMLCTVTVLGQEKLVATGIVRTTERKPIEFAQVRALKNGETISIVLTDSLGRFVFYQLPDGAVTFVISHQDYVSQTLSDYKIRRGETLSMLVDMVAAKAKEPTQQQPASSKLTITGIVRDTAGVVMRGANISVQGNNIATTSDENGKFILDVPANSSIVVSFAGHDPESVLITKDSKNVEVVLRTAKVDPSTEVVVTAYGQRQTKESVVGSITTIAPEELKIPSSNLTNALAGQAAGIIAYQPNGQPGYDNSQFFIRGVTTFGYNSQPLILIDNIESSSTDLARLQVDDIATFSILKDASATALYGARGANGVLLITTKKGKLGKAQIYARLENSISQPTQTLKLTDPITYMQLYNEAQTSRDPKAIPLYDANRIYNTQQTINGAEGSNPYVYPAVDWLDMLFKPRTNNQRANLSVRGGGQVAQYYVSGSYNLDRGILKVSPVNNFNNNVKLQNTQFRSNVDINLTKTTVLSLLLNGSFDDYNGPITSDPSGGSDLYAKAMYASPVLFPAYFEPDSANVFTKHILFGNTTINGVNNLFNNPYADLLRGYSQFSRSTMNAQVNLKQDLGFITRGLNFNGMFSTSRNAYFSLNRRYNPFYYQIGNYDFATDKYSLFWINNLQGQATEYLDYSPGERNINSQIYFQGVLNYNRTFGKHKVNATYITALQQILQTVNQGDDVNTLLQLSLPRRNMNSSTRLSYTFDNRYIVEPSFAYNGSERFAEKNRFGFFPTLGVAWVVSNENFWSDKIKNIISSFKLRGSYGVVGNDAISRARFFYLSSVNLTGGAPATFGVNGVNTVFYPGASISNYPNPDVTWERSKQLDIGMDVTFLRSLNLTVDVYQYERSDIYQQRLALSTLGLETGVGANLGTASSKGVDVQMDYAKTLAKDWSFAARGNFTYAQSEYGMYEEANYPHPWMYRSGTVIGRSFGYIAERLFVDDAEANNSPRQLFANGVAPMGGDIKYKDINNDGQINSLDQVPLGYPTTPQITYGFGGSAKWKSLDLNFFFQGNSMVSFFINPRQVSPFISATVNNSSANANSTAQVLQMFADDRWSLQNQNLYATYPRLGLGNAITNNLQNSTWWMRDGSFIRLKSVELGYTLPANWLRKISVNNCRIYASGLNLINFSRFKAWDVEQGGNGFAYPIQRVFNLGAYFSFQ